MDIQDALPSYQAVIAETIERMVEAFPVLRGAMGYVVMDDYAGVAKAQLEWNREHNTLSMGLHFNYAMFRAEGLDTRTAHGPLQRIVAHECAHLVEYAIAMRRAGVRFGEVTEYERIRRLMIKLEERQFAKNLRAAVLLATGFERGDVAQALTPYAAVNESEFVAEAVAEAMTAEEPRALARETYDQLLKWAVKYA